MSEHRDSAVVAEGSLQWPQKELSVTSSSLPVIASTVPIGSIEARIIVETFDPVTTRISGTIVLTNLSQTAQALHLCLDGNSFSYHLRMKYGEGSAVLGIPGTYHNWAAVALELAPSESCRRSFSVVLKEFFPVGSGTYRLLFVYNRNMVPGVPKQGPPMRSWAKEQLVLSCE